MKKFKFTKTLRIDDSSLDDIFDDNDSLQLKAERLIKRRERQLRNQMLRF